MTSSCDSWKFVSVIVILKASSSETMSYISRGLLLFTVSACRGDRSHFFKLWLRSCSKMFESVSGSGSGYSTNLRIRLPFRLRLQPSFKRNLPTFYLKNVRTDSCYCRNGKVTPDPGMVFHKFFTPGPDPRPKEKRAILQESTPVIRVRSHFCCLPEVCMDWILDFVDPNSGCVWQDSDPGFRNKNRTRTGFGFFNLLMKNGLWDWAVAVIANYLSAATVTTVLQVFQSVPRNDRKVHYGVAVAMHEWFTHKLFSWLRDMAV